MIDLSHVALYLGVEFNKFCNGLFLSQRTYILHIFKEFDIEECIPSPIPMFEGLQLRIKKESSKIDTKIFQKVVGMLIYLINTKSKILFIISVLSKFIHDHRVLLLEAVTHVLQYIKRALVFGIFYAQNKNTLVIGYIDLD
uniref:Reverse transcriptase Ty1/copia-type domain-containing protein n=1 Tax=Physcomitrium patens TaxID=3218 RepID=A0A2K1IAB1_PHYPA|nr:hypothetical protein PHYPA_030790 [Physcomitrium patens]